MVVNHVIVLTVLAVLPEWSISATIITMSGIARPGTAADTAVVINNVGLLMLLDNVTDSCNNLLQEGAPAFNRSSIPTASSPYRPIPTVKRMLIFEEFFMKKCLIRIRHLKI